VRSTSPLAVAGSTAAAMGTSVSKVKTAAHEARGRLRVLLADVYQDTEA
jgi:DNA-directed RNA polymerase specialized sigma24 family protein